MVKIALDAGHGGTDNGASGNGIHEKDITLAIIKKIHALLNQYENVEIIETRPSDVFVSLDERCNIANKFGADVFLSVHINAGDPTAHGFESHRYNGTQDPKTIAYQNTMHSAIYNAIKGNNITDRGKKASNFAVVRQTTMPAILTENEFITNATEAGLMKQESFLQTVAQGHVNGFEQFLGLKKNTNAPPTAPINGKLYKVQVGAFSDPDNADKLYKDLLAKGYSAYIVEE